MSYSVTGAATAPRKVMIGILQTDTGGASFQALVNDERTAVVNEGIVNLSVRTKDAGCNFGIFAAPEYLFSNQNSKQPIGLAASGKYYARGISEEQKERNLDEMKSLSKIYSKLILIPGTMAWLKPFDREQGIDRHKLAEKTLRDPTKAVETRQEKAINALQASKTAANALGYGSLTGGRDFGNRKIAKPALKESRITSGKTPDMLRNSLYVIADGEVLHKYNKVADYHEVLNRQDQKSVFVPGDAGRQIIDLFGKQFGFEICLDHAFDVLGFGNTALPVGAVDIQILLSASVATTGTRINNGGLFIHASSDRSQTLVLKRVSSGVVNIAELTLLCDILTKSGGPTIEMRYFQTEIVMPSLPGA